MNMDAIKSGGAFAFFYIGDDFLSYCRLKMYNDFETYNE